jgi:hypothetical protein
MSEQTKCSVCESTTPPLIHYSNLNHIISVALSESRGTNLCTSCKDALTKTYDELYTDVVEAIKDHINIIKEGRK